MGHVRSYLTSRVMATGAAVALLGGGAALADPASQAFEAQTTADTIGDETLAEESQHDDGDVPGSDDEGPASTEVDDSSDVPEQAPDPEEELDQQTPRETTADDGERSDTARAVHRALTGSADPSPGDPGFGEAVSKNARNGGNGAAASEAARGQRGNSPEGRGRPEGPSDDRGSSSAPGQAEDRASPPSNASDEDRVGPPDHAPARGFRAKGNDDANGTVDDDTYGAEGNDDE